MRTLVHVQRLAAQVPRPRRLKWVFNIHTAHGPNGGAREPKTIAARLERPVVDRVLTHRGLDLQRPPRSRAREAGQVGAAAVAPAGTNSSPSP